jgi:hypothetical protein
MRLQPFFIALLMLAGVGCSPTPQVEKTSDVPAESIRVSGNGIYYWKNVFELNDTERNFLTEHQVKRLYLRFFDVVPADPGSSSNYHIEYEAVPSPTVSFRDTVPEGVEIVPVVYITIEALRLINSSFSDYSSLIVERILNMADFHDLGALREVQLDCDWTQQTQEGYFALCQAVRDQLAPLGIQLSCTIRLWQLACACPPVDRGVLMLYNTGNITDPDTRNSILDLDDVKAYLKGQPYGLPLDIGYPVFSWYVWFRDNGFMGLFHQRPDNDTVVKAGDVLRYEHVGFDELHAVDSFVRLNMPDDDASVILFTLDSANLSNYTSDEIRQLYRHY